MAKKVLLVDDHPVVCKGLKVLLERSGDFVVCGEAKDRKSALKLAWEHKPHLAIVDVSLVDSNGLDVVRDLKLSQPATKILMLSMREESVYAERALKAGADGYMMKNEPPEVLMEAVARVLEGRIHLSEEMASVLLKRHLGTTEPNPDPVASLLTDRELEVFGYIGKGVPTRKIADLLHLSVKTVEGYRSSIRRKLNLRNGIDLARRAVLWVEEEDAG